MAKQREWATSSPSNVGNGCRLAAAGALIALLAVSTASQAQVIVASASCTGAFEEIDPGGSLISRFIPTGGSATCIETPEQPPGFEPTIRADGQATLTVNPGVFVQNFDFTGDQNEIINDGTTAGDVTGDLTKITNRGDGTFLVQGAETQLDNLGTASLQAIGDMVNVTNGGAGGVLTLSIEGDDGRLSNDEDALVQALIEGLRGQVTNRGAVASVEVQGDEARILNEGTTTNGIDGNADGLGFLVVGNDAEVVNSGSVAEFSDPIIAPEALGIGILGDDARVENTLTGSIVVSGVESIAVGVQGDFAEVNNAGEIGAVGTGAVGVSIEGDIARIVNDGEVQTSGAFSSGLSVEGLAGEIINNQSIVASGSFAAGMIAAGTGAEVTNAQGATITTELGAILAAGALGDGARVLNEGTITTQGANAFGIGALGQGLTLTNAAGASIATNGANADAMVFGLSAIPAGGEPLELPAEAFDPASGQVTNSGDIVTFGAGADGINAFAANATVTNNSTIETNDDNAHAIATRGDNVDTTNLGTLTTNGQSAMGIRAIGTGSDLVNGTAAGGVLSARIETSGQAGHGIYVGGAAANSQSTVINHGLIQSSGADASGIVSEAAGVTIDNQGLILANDGFGIFSLAADNEVTNNSVIRAGEPPGLNGGDAQGAGGIIISNDSRATNAAGAEITVFGDGGVGMEGQITAGALLRNDGLIRLTGDQAMGINLAGTVDPNDQRSQAVNNGVIQVGINGLLDPLEPEDPELNPAFSPPDGGVGVRLSERVEFTNDETGKINVIGDNAVGVQATKADPVSDTEIINRGEITAMGISAHGIDATGDNLLVFNGSIGDTAKIVAQGANAIGIRTEGADQFVHNKAQIDVSGANSTLIEVNVTGVGQLYVDNSADLSLSGNNAIAMHVRSAVEGTPLAIQDSTARAGNCIGGGLAGGRVISCGALQLVDTASSTGMLVEGLKDTFIENQGGITGDAASQRGIIVNSGVGAAASDGQVNIIENFAAIDLDGASSTGAVLNANGNFFFNGSGTSDFSLAPDLPDALRVSISSTIDRMEARTTANGTEESQKVGAEGVIDVSGIGSVGLLVNGDSNLISNRLSQIIEGVEGNVSEVAGRIVASGSDGIGIELQGNNNVVDNEGLISGALFAVLGHEGNDTLINRNEIEGLVALGGGNDNLVLLPGAVFTSTVDGGDGEDNLIISGPKMPPLGPGDPQIPLLVGEFDGSLFADFENFHVDLPVVGPAVTNLAVVMNNTLRVDTAVIDGSLILNDAFLNASDISINAFSTLGGNGLVGSDPNVDPLGFLSTEISIADQALVAVGNSAGTIGFLGNVTSSGIFEIEIGGTDMGLYDVIEVQGDLDFLGGEMVFQFIDGFVPGLGDMFDFLRVGGSVTGFDLLQFSFLGLPTGFDFDVNFDGSGLSLLAAGTPTTTPVPEPGSLALLLSGLLVAFRARRAFAAPDDLPRGP